MAFFHAHDFATKQQWHFPAADLYLGEHLHNGFHGASKTAEQNPEIS